MAQSIPSISPTLSLVPAKHEQAFWTSQVFRNGQLKRDAWARCLTLAINTAFLLYQHLQRNSHQAGLRANRSIIAIIQTSLEALWAKFAPRSYQQSSRYVLWFHKLSLFTATCYIAPFTVRNTLLHPPTNPTLTHLLPPSLTPPTHPSSTTLPTPPTPTNPLSTPQTLTLATLTLSPLLDALIRPLPLLPQLTLHTLYTLSLTYLHLHPAAHLLSRLAPTLTTTCHTLNTLLIHPPALAAPSLPSTLLSLSSLCTAHAIPVLILFTNLYFGLLLPSFFGYRFERQLKLTYLCDLAAARSDMDAAYELHEQMAFPQPMDVLVPALLPLPCWVASLWAHRFVESWALPL